jgi:hypothetical protein
MALLLFMTLAAWSMGSAVGSSPDEDYVLTSIWCGTEGNPPYCRKDPTNDQAMIVPELVGMPSLCYFMAGPSKSARCQAESYDNDQLMPTEAYNKGLYPFRYFNIVRNFVEYDVAGSVIKVRLFNSAIAAVLILAVASLTRNRLNSTLLALFSISSPVAFYFIASVNTSSWGVTSVIGFTLASIVIVQNFRNTKIFFPALFFALISVFLAVSARKETKYILLVLGAMVIAGRLYKLESKSSKKAIFFSLSAITFMLVATSKEIRTFGRFSALTKNLIIDEFGNDSQSLIIQNVFDLPIAFLGFFGFWGLGKFEVELPSIVWLLVVINFTLIVRFTFKNLNRNLRIFGYGAFGLLALIILEFTQQSQREIDTFIQPRYLLPFFLGIIIFLTSNLKIKLPNTLTAKITLMAVVANSVALRTTLRRYTSGLEIDLAKSLNNYSEWWWQFGPSPEQVWLIGTFAFAALLVLLEFEKSREAVRQEIGDSD